MVKLTFTFNWAVLYFKIMERLRISKLRFRNWIAKKSKIT